MRGYPNLLFAILCSFILITPVVATPPQQTTPWQTFLGSASNDQATALAIDAAGQVYVVGNSNATWGQPIASYNGGRDAFVAKFSPTGQLLWHTFLGGKLGDSAVGVAIGADQKLYVVGTSEANWGKPRQKYAGQNEVFIAQFNEAGEFQWHTFYGSAGDDTAHGLTVDADGMVYVVGDSDSTWGVRPLTVHGGDLDAFVLKLNDQGRYQWHTFLGGNGVDSSQAIAVNRQGQIYVAGTSSETWGQSTLMPHAGDFDAFITKLDTNGQVTWNTFLGTATGSDNITALTLDKQGALYVAGNSWDGWGKPVAPFNGQGFFDAFAAKLTPDGQLTWHTFMGSPSQLADADTGYGLTVDGAGHVYLIGDSRESWGQPLNPFAGGRDIFIANLTASNGQREWHAFLGATENDYGNAVAVNAQGELYALGYSQMAWGQPLTAPAGSNDGFLIQLPACLPNCPVINMAANISPSITTTMSSTVTSSTIVTTTPTLSTTVVNTPTVTNTPILSPTITPTLSVTTTPTLSPTVTPTLSPTITFTILPTITPTISLTVTPTLSPTITPTLSPTVTPILSPTLTPLPIVTPAISPTMASLAIATTTPMPTPTSPMTATTTVSSGTLQLSLTDLGYEEVKLRGPYGVTEYEFRLPQHWDFTGEPFIRLDIDFLYNPLTQTKPAPDIALYGNIIVAIDGQTQSITPIQSAPLLNNRFRVPLPLELLNSPEQTKHTLSIALDTSPNCAIPHDARLVIHPDTSYISLDYQEQPLQVDLARYPYPFNEPQYQSNGTTDKPKPGQIWLVLPTIPNEAELRAAVAVAARLGNLGLQVDGMTDQDLLTQVQQGQPPAGHFVMIGTPNRNQMVAHLSSAMPTPFRQRQLNLQVEGPTNLTTGSEVTYKLTVANPTQTNMQNLTLSNMLPSGAIMQRCDPTCQPTNTPHESTWEIKSLPAGGSVTFAITARLTDTAKPNDKLTNIAMVLNQQGEPLEVNALTPTNGANETQSNDLLSGEGNGYFLAQKGWAAAPTDGVVQGLTAPWNSQQAILVISGLSDEAVNKAGQAMGIAEAVPGLSGSLALIDQIQAVTNSNVAPNNVNTSLEHLGYTKQQLDGSNPATRYQFDLPNGWRLLDGATLDLHFDHSQLLNFDRSSLRVLFNGKPIAEMLLKQQTAMTGQVTVNLPVDRAQPGQTNEITVQARLEALDRCADFADNWFAIDSTQSQLNLAYKEEGAVTPGFEVFPRPFNQQANLANVLFVLPAKPVLAEWQQAIRLAASIGAATQSAIFAPSLTLQSEISDDKLQQSHLIVIGRPSRNPVLAQLNDQLPQPFVVETDLLEQQLNQVVLRLRSGVSLGVLELTRSPDNQGLLVVSGTTDEGVAQAGELLTHGWQRLGVGNLAFINGTEVNTLDTRDLTQQGVAQAVAETVPQLDESTPITPTEIAAPIETVMPTQATLPTTQPTWLMPLMGASAALVIVILAVAYWQSRRKG